MKAIIIAGISLFAAATIYGVTDFAADKKKGTIDKLYKEEPAAPAVEEKEVTVTPVAAKAEKAAVAVKTEATAKKTAASKKVKKLRTPSIKDIKFSDFSRGRIEKKEVREVPVVETKKDK